MSEELKEITRLCEIIKEKDKEIERLQRQKEELQVNGLRQETLFKLEIERLHSIIKEVRDYIKSRQNTLNEIKISRILEILDKGNKC